MQGRSPTCYSPVRHSSNPERAFPFDLHVLSTPPAFVLSQDQTLQTKPSKRPIRETNLTTATSHKLAKTVTPLNGKKKHDKKQQQTKTTKHTIEFSNNTPARPRDQPAAFGHWSVVRMVRNPPKWDFPLGRRRAQRFPASRRRDNKLREGKLGVKWPDGACFSIPLPSCARKRASTPTTHPTRSTPAIFRLPRRSTSHRPCRKSAGCGTHSSLSIRTLLT